jgi:hypothetical protein
VSDLPDRLDADAAGLVRGTVALGVDGLDTEADVCAAATSALFDRFERLREAAAVQQYCHADATRADLVRLAGRYDPSVVEELVAEYRDRVRPVDRAGAASELVGTADADAAALLRGGVGVDPGADADEVDLLAGGIETFFDRHETLRHAAAARCYENRPTMTTAAAAMLADVPVAEIASLLCDHGVTPRVGPGSQEEFRRSLETARRAYGSADDAAGEASDRPRSEPDS